MSTSETRFVSALNEELRLLGRTGRVRKFDDGEIIFSAGDAGDGFYLVDSGRVQISAVVGNGQTRTLADKLYLSIDEGSIVFIRGSVFSDGGRSVAGVKVELARIISDNAIQKLDSRVTGETGEFVFRLPPDPGKYRLTLKADGTEPSSKDVEVESAAVYRVALTYKKKT